jgi:hypothetical protein
MIINTVKTDKQITQTNITNLQLTKKNGIVYFNSTYLIPVSGITLNKEFRPKSKITVECIYFDSSYEPTTSVMTINTNGVVTVKKHPNSTEATTGWVLANVSYPVGD